MQCKGFGDMGDVCEYLKKGCCFVVFQIASADLMIPIGHGKVVALMNMVDACGRSHRNLYWSEVDDSLRKFSVIGPHFQCGSMAIGRRIMFCETDTRIKLVRWDIKYGSVRIEIWNWDVIVGIHGVGLNLHLSASICFHLHPSASICFYLFLSASICINLHPSASICIPSSRSYISIPLIPLIMKHRFIYYNYYCTQATSNRSGLPIAYHH